MRSASWALALGLSVLAGRSAYALSGTSSVAAGDWNELKRALREELKAELKAELAAEGATGDAGSSWGDEEWKWEEPAKPELNFLEIDGYFRFRYDWFHRADLGLYRALDAAGDGVLPSGEGPLTPGFAPSTPACNTDSRCVAQEGEGKTLGSANMRLRLEPVFNVFEDIKVKTQLDLLDNVVLGSTPDGFPGTPSPRTPLVALSRSQTAPSDGVNALRDSLRVKRAWAEVMTPLGQLRVGRMPLHFGMGILSNEGAGLDADFGDSVDRIMFATKVSDFHIMPAFDWVASGPTSQVGAEDEGQPFDRDQRDDVDQFSVIIAKQDDPARIQERLDNDEWVVNYGTMQMGRFQGLDAQAYHGVGAGEAGPSASATERRFEQRDFKAYLYSYWLRILWRKLSIEAEYAGMLGTIGRYDAGSGGRKISIAQHGAAMEVQYRLLKDAMTLRFHLMLATGDDAPGWGVRPLYGAAGGTTTVWESDQAADRSLNNFRFHPAYNIDLILWRQLIGTVTDAVIFKPGLQYNLTPGFGFRFDVLYSRAWSSASTPSASLSLDGRGAEGNLGIEADLKLFYDSDDGFHSWLEYGLLVPLGGLDYQTLGASAEIINASVAHTLQVMLGVSF